MARFRSTFVGLDLEATDLSVDGGKIIEVAAVRWADGREVAQFSALIDPGEPIPPIITSITGIRDQDVAGKPSFAAVRDELAAFIGEAPVVGHNIQFDIGFLKANGLALGNPTYDTWKLATLLLPRAQSHSLESLAAELKLTHPEAHRALHDARVGAELFMYLTDKLGAVEASTARRLLALVQRHRYSLTPVFAEVLGGLPAAATTKRRTARPAAAAQSPLPLKPEAALTPGWIADGRGSRAKVTVDAAELDRFFSKQVAAVVPGFELRAEQVALARTLHASLNGNRHLVVEAAPGVGRREAALVAAAADARTSNVRTIYAVAGRKELARTNERAAQLAPLGFGSYTVLGQPSDYVSLHAVDRFVDRPKLTEVEVQLAAKLLLWLPTTTTGHLDELSLVWEEQLLASEVTSSTHTCDKKSEPEKCSYCAAVLRSAEAPVTLVTHRTLLDMLGTGTLKPTDRLVIDDGHLLEDATTESLGTTVHQGTLERALDRAAQEVATATQATVEEVRSHLTLLAGLVGVFVEGQATEDSWAGVRTVILTAGHEAEPAYKRVRSGLETLVQKLAALEKSLGPTSLAGRSLQGLQVELERFATVQPDRNVVQIQLNDRQQFVLRSQPVEVREFLAEKLWGRTPSVVLLGPRLTVERRFAYLRQRLGVPKDVREHVVASPHRLAERTAIVSLSDHPDPAAAGWAEATGRAIAQLSQALRGRVLVIFSSRTSILSVHGVVEDLLAGSGTKLLAQGLSGGRGKAIQTLARNPQAVLMASYTFLERASFAHGFRAVVLVRLPFSVPTEPLTAARKKALASGFRELELPRVALKVREQFDRIIQARDDRGLLVVLDQKFQKEYASAFLDSLPDVPTHVVPAAKLSETVAPFAKPLVEKPRKRAQ